MKEEDNVLQVVMRINRISNNPRLSFKAKIDSILSEIVTCFHAEQASVMVIKNRKNLELVSSLNPELVGKTQSLDEDTPSTWVVKNKKTFYSKDASCSILFQKKFDHYKKDAFLVTPIMSNDKVLGVLSVTDRMNSDRFTDQEQEMLLTIAGNVISALQNNRLADSLKRKKRVLNQKNSQLTKLEKLRTELFNMLIHDLKGPISEVIANLDILSYVVSGDHQEYVEQAQSSCDLLYSMIVDLLDIARMEEGSLNMVSEKINPDEFIHEAVTHLTGLARGKSIELRNPGLPRQEVTFDADKGLLIRVMHNLLTNAIQHCPQGERVEVGYDTEDSGRIRFSVKDNGPGIPEEHQNSIFEKFVQLSRKNDGRRYTTGLGLTYCKMAVELHGGSIWVESDGENGSTFIFSLPL
jgi:K+-sensing histidine kinase KdpD